MMDWYFGKDEAERFGDLICEKLAGKTVSKRKDLAEEPGGLIYEANRLGIEDFFDLLKALREKYIYHSCASVSVYFKSPDMHTISSYYTMYLHESQDIMIVSGGVNALKISPARARLPFKM